MLLAEALPVNDGVGVDDTDAVREAVDVREPVEDAVGVNVADAVTDWLELNV